jgi:hypothetical protein
MPESPDPSVYGLFPAETFSSGVYTYFTSSPLPGNSLGDENLLLPNIGGGSNGQYALPCYYQPPPGFYGRVTITYVIHGLTSLGFDISSSQYFLYLEFRSNLPPNITGPVTALYDSSGTDSPLTTVIVHDDALAAQNIRMIVAGSPSGVDPSLATEVGLTKTSVTFEGNAALQYEGTVVAMNQALTNGIVYSYVGGTNAYLRLFVDDLGSGPITKPAQNVTKTIQLVAATNIDRTLETVVGAAGALVGVTTVASIGVYGVYAVLKRRKLLPDEADPWENDELWDATIDNPLFSGVPVQNQPVYDSE